MSIIRRVQMVVTGVAGSPYYINHYFNVTDGSSQDCYDAVDQYHTDASNTFVPQGSVWSSGTEVQHIDTLTGDLVTVDVVSPKTRSGTATNPLLPPATQALVKWRTGAIVAGKRIAGRTFIPLRYESDNTATGVLEPVLITALNARNNTYLSGPTTPVVWSKKNGEAYPITAADVNSAWSILRSRRSV